VPVTVTAYVPAGVAALVVIVSVLLPPEVTEDGLNDALAPDGRPDADNATDSAEPDVTAVDTVVVAAEPAVTLPEAGERATEKSLAAEPVVTVRV
jgi:hypothetical protein